MQIQVCDNINCQGATGKLFSTETVLKPPVDLAPEPLTLDQADKYVHEYGGCALIFFSRN